MLGEADKHMSPKMRDAFVESLLANEKNPMQHFMQLGVSTEELMKVMDAYGNGVEKPADLVEALARQLIDAGTPLLWRIRFNSLTIHPQMAG